jgi:hypothetical protein
MSAALGQPAAGIIQVWKAAPALRRFDRNRAIFERHREVPVEVELVDRQWPQARIGSVRHDDRRWT